MNERFDLIERKLDGIDTKIDALTGFINPQRGQSEKIRQEFDALGEKIRLLSSVIRKMAGVENAPQEKYSVAEAATRLGLSRFSVRQKCNKGQIRGEKVDGAGEKGEWRIKEEELRRYEREGDLNPPEPPPR